MKASPQAPNPRRKRCTWCGELIEVGKERSVRDCADIKHDFHPKCWKKQCAWLQGKDVS